MAIEMKEISDIPEGMYEGAACPMDLKGPQLIREISKWYALEHRSTGWIIDINKVSSSLNNVAYAKEKGLMPDRKSSEVKAIYERGLSELERSYLNEGGTILIDHTGTKIR